MREDILRDNILDALSKCAEDLKNIEENLISKLCQNKGVENDLQEKIYECLEDKLKSHGIQVLKGRSLEGVGGYIPDISIKVMETGEIYICEIKSANSLSNLIAFTQSYGCPDEAVKGFHYHLCKYISALRKHILDETSHAECTKVYKVHAITYDILKYAICDLGELEGKLKGLFIIGLFTKSRNDPACDEIKEFFKKFIDYLKPNNLKEISNSHEYIRSKLRREIININEAISCDCKKVKVKENKGNNEKEVEKEAEIEVCLIYLILEFRSKNEAQQKEVPHA